jgi:hypothetical protein
MGDVEILHRLFTNAAEDGAPEAAKARNIPLADRDAESFVTPDVLTALDDLLRKTNPSSQQDGWVVRRFGAADGRTYACVITSDPSLVDAGKDRVGFLNHARLVAVDGPSFDAAALIEIALDFPIDDVRREARGRRLQAYRDAIAGEPSSVLVRTVAVSELQNIATDVLEDVLVAWLSNLDRRRHERISTATLDPMLIAQAWAALPLATQRRSSWAIGVTESCPVDVIFSNVDGRADAGGEALVKCVRDYVRLLHAAPSAFESMLDNASIIDATTLASMVQRQALAPELSSISREGEMSNKDKAPKGAPRRDRDSAAPEWQPLDADLRKEMNRQLAAMETLLRASVEERIAFALKDLQRTQTTTSRAAPRVDLSGRWMWIGAVVSLLLLAGAAYWFIGRPLLPREPRTAAAAAPVFTPDRPDQGATNTQSDEPPPTSAQRAAERAAVSGRWAEEWKALLETDPRFASDAIGKLARQTELSADADRVLNAFSDVVARNADLGTDGRDRLRVLLIECLGANESDGTKIKVDGKLTDVAPLVGAVKKRYGVTNKSTDLTQKSLQSEIVLRWMAGLEP